MNQEALLGRARKHLIRYPSGFAPFVIRQAQGSWIWDQDGRGQLLGLEIVRTERPGRPAPEPGATITAQRLKCGLSMNLVRGMGASVWRLGPPLRVAEGELDLAFAITYDRIQAVGRRGLDGRMNTEVPASKARCHQMLRRTDDRRRTWLSTELNARFWHSLGDS